ncbi:MAG: UDP-N-acetylglucosamine 2-epimerase (non-hydrolyzing) [Sulfuricurvum sp.]|nr:UDP-N-acetylglucosamine 2-epimerase (non-hydrolyzing) [Sulfuricurvum sp.]
MMNIALVFGTRPEAIKMVPIIDVLKRKKELFKTTIIVTGQHKEMLQQHLEVLQCSPDINFDVMSNNQSLFDITNAILSNIKEFLQKIKPDLVLVHGDTTTAMVSALCAFYLKIPVGHVEAGLRTHQRYSPYPEEMNRKLIADLATFHFAPTKQSYDNLINEGIKSESIEITGNTVIDALFKMINTFQDQKNVDRINCKFLKTGYRPDLNKIVLITGHRRENFGYGIDQICEAIYRLAKEYSDIDFVYPVHMNPNVRSKVYKILSDVNNVYLLEPLDYDQFVFLMKASYIILTDSGGIQEEAAALGKPTLVMRNISERPEVLFGSIKVVGTKADNIFNEAKHL